MSDVITFRLSLVWDFIVIIHFYMTEKLYTASVLSETFLEINIFNYFIQISFLQNIGMFLLFF